MHMTQPNKRYRRVVVHMLVPADIPLSQVTDGINELLNESALHYGPERSAFHDYMIDARDEKTVVTGEDTEEGAALSALMTTDLNRPRRVEDLAAGGYEPVETGLSETCCPLPQIVERFACLSVDGDQLLLDLQQEEGPVILCQADDGDELHLHHGILQHELDTARVQTLFGDEWNHGQILEHIRVNGFSETLRALGVGSA